MANRRSIHKKISLSEQLADLSDLACLCYTWAIPHADDWGTLKGSPRVFKATVLPLRDVTAEQVAGAIAEVVNAGLWIAYEVAGEQYLHFPTWEQHQTGLHKRTEAGRLPLPEDAGQSVKASEVDSTSGKFREVPGSSTLREVKGSEGKRTEEKRDSSPEADSAPGGPEEKPAEPRPEKPDTRTDTQKAIDAAWQAHGFPLPTGDHDKPHETTGNPTTAGFGGLVKLCNSKGLPLVREWTAHVAAAHPQVPDGANRWEWFKDQFRSALNRPWEWKQKRLDTGPRIAGDWSAPGAADPPEQV